MSYLDTMRLYKPFVRITCNAHQPHNVTPYRRANIMPLARSRSHPSHPSRSLDSLDETAARTAGRSRPYAEPNDTSRISAAERGASNCHNLSRTVRPAVMERSICTVSPAHWARAGTGRGAVERLTGDPATVQTGNLSALEFYQCPTCSDSSYAVALAWARGRIGGSRCGAVPKGGSS